MKLSRDACQVHQVVGVDDQRSNSVLLTQEPHPAALCFGESVRPPLPGAGRKDLKRIRSQPVRPLGSQFHSTRGGGVYAYAPRSWRGRITLGPHQNIFHAELALFRRHAARGLILALQERVIRWSPTRMLREQRKDAASYSYRNATIGSPLVARRAGM